MKPTHTTLASLQAHMPSKTPTMNLAPIQRVLGADMPDITPTPLGRYRLIAALKNKFGPSFKNYPQAAQALSHFDSEADYFSKISQMGVK